MTKATEKSTEKPKTKEKSEIEEYKFTKAQFLSSLAYSKYRDFLSGNLEDDKTYTTKEIDELIKTVYGN